METVVPLNEADHSARAVDVLIVGYGIAGACAALEAREAGSEVLVIERASGAGGTSATSEGIFYLGGGTAMQRDCGVEDDAEQLYRFLESATSAPRDKLRVFADNSAAHFDWLEAQGVPFSRNLFTAKAVALKDPEGGLLTTGNEKAWPHRDVARPAPRGHQARRSDERSSGSFAMEAIVSSAERAGVEALYDAQAVSLIMDGNRVAGVRVRHDGALKDILARRGVIIATGSFNSNPEWVTRHCPQVSETCVPIGIPYNDGSGMALGQSAGGALEGMDGIIATASIYPPANLIKGIVVNKKGERFIAEDVYHGRLADHISEQPDQTAYLIVDSEIFDYPQNDPNFHRLIDGYDTVAEMEAGLGIPAGALAATLEAYNADAAQHEDRQFHKYHDWIKPLDKAPYAAFDISFNKSRYAFLTLGGLSTNVDGQVLDGSGAVIPGLYAAGACAAQITRNGKEYASGLTLGPGSFFGRLAGRHAAHAPASVQAVAA